MGSGTLLRIMGLKILNKLKRLSEDLIQIREKIPYVRYYFKQIHDLQVCKCTNYY